MREMWLILKREFTTRVKSKSFVIGTILLPIFMSAMVAVPAMLSQRSGSARHLVLVDEAPAGIGDRFVAELSGLGNNTGENSYKISRVNGTLVEQREALNVKIVRKQIAGYIVLPNAIVESGEFQYRAASIGSITVDRDLRQAANRAVQYERLRRAGVETVDLPSILRPAKLSSKRVTAKGEEDGSAASTFLFAYLVTFCIYLLTVIYGVHVLRGVLEEKTSRIAEVILSSTEPRNLMLGKVLGIGSVALLQVAIWVLMGIALMGQGGLIAMRMSLPPEILQSFAIEPWVAVALLTFFVLGFLIYASLFAALGAAVTTEQEAQSLQMLILLPIMAPLFFISKIMNDPSGTAATVLSWCPLTSPISMPMRMAAGSVPGSQVAGTLVVLIIAVVVLAWISGKIYRVGILSTGRKPTLKELVRWLKMA